MVFLASLFVLIDFFPLGSGHLKKHLQKLVGCRGLGTLETVWENGSLGGCQSSKLKYIRTGKERAGNYLEPHTELFFHLTPPHPSESRDSAGHTERLRLRPCPCCHASEELIHCFIILCVWEFCLRFCVCIPVCTWCLRRLEEGVRPTWH